MINYINVESAFGDSQHGVEVVRNAETNKALERVLDELQRLIAKIERDAFQDGVTIGRAQERQENPMYTAFKAEVKRLLDACPDNDISEELAKLIAEGESNDV